MEIDIRHDPKGNKKYPWILLKSITVTLSNGDIITIPEEMRTDLRSSPKWLWSIIPPFCDSLPAYIIHDYLYIYDYKVDELGLVKAQRFADKEMRYWCNELDKGNRADYLSFIAVRIFGHKVFKKLRTV